MRTTLSHKFIVKFLILPVLPCLSFGSYASDDVSLEDLLNLDAMIVTASKKAEKLSDAPATVYVVTKKEIRDRGYSFLKDALHDLPGMEVHENYFSEIGTLVPVRGIIGNNKLVVLINGMRINPPGGEFLPIRSDLSIRHAERIEVIYGPGSTLYGQDAINGVINIITKKSGDDLAANASLRVGENNHAELYASVSKNIGKGKFTFYVHNQDSELDDLSKTHSAWHAYHDLNDSIASDIAQMERPDEGINAFARFETEDSSFQVSYRDSTRSSSEGGFAGILYYQDEALWHDSSLTVEGRTTFELNDDMSWETKILYNNYEIDPETQYVFPLGVDTLADFDYKYGIGSMAEFEGKFSWDINEKWGLISGVSTAYFDILPKATVPGGAEVGIDIAAQAGDWCYQLVADSDASNDICIPRVNNVTYQQSGFYIEAQGNPTEQLKVTFGLRTDANTLYTDKPISPRASAIYSFSDSLKLKFIYTQAYVSPAPYFGYATYFNGPTINITNPTLEPETADSFEVNLSYIKDSLLVNLSAYSNQQDNILLLGDEATSANFVVAGFTADGGAVDITQAANSGETSTTGFDLFSKYSITDKNLDLWGSLSIVDSTRKRDGAKTGLDKISGLNLRLGATYQPMDKLTVTGSLEYRDEPEGIKDGYVGPLSSEFDSLYQLNAYVRYDVTDMISLSLSAKNLSDNQYATRGILTPTVNEGRKFIIGIEADF